MPTKPIIPVEFAAREGRADAPGLGHAAITEVRSRLARIEQILELLPIVLLQAGAEPTHLQVDVAARLAKVSPRTIRRRILRGELTLEVVPGTRATGIPITEFVEGWVSLRTARAAFERERATIEKRVRCHE